MSSNRTVTDEEILSGFASVHQAVATGFDRLSAEMRQMRETLSDHSRQFLDVRNDISRLEQRMLRRFDDVDERLDNHEIRIAALEAKT